MSEFIKRNKLQLNWDIKNTKQDNTYVNYNLDQFSCIDHFLISQYLFDLSIDSCTIHELNNMSNHVPLVVNFLLNVDYLKMAPKVSQVTGRIAWHKVAFSHIVNYQDKMDLLLDKINMDFPALLCNDISCVEASHKHNIDDVTEQLINIAIQSGRYAFPSCVNSHIVIPRWDEEIQPLKESSLFWHHLWLQCDKPKKV